VHFRQAIHLLLPRVQEGPRRVPSLGVLDGVNRHPADAVSIGVHGGVTNGGPMKGRFAGLLFLGVCVTLAVLLLLHVISPVVSGAVFAIALVAFGVSSRGFRKE
jgi:hypothetical protein